MEIHFYHIYKPKRLLYYIKATQTLKDDFYNDVLPDKLLKYEGLFGTYDCPGLFKIKNGDSYDELLGIEFRPDDERICYPDDLEYIELESCFMFSGLYTQEGNISDDVIDEGIAFINERHNIDSYYLPVVPQSSPDIIQVFVRNKKYRVMLRAYDVTEEVYCNIRTPETDLEKELHQLAYYDVITNHPNWNYINHIIAGFGFKGIQDFSFVHFDVKDFNAINVIYGHIVANKVLRNIARKLDECEWVYYSARCHNDNFAVMIKDMPEEETRQKLGQFFEVLSVLEEDPHYKIAYRVGVVPMRNSILLSDRVADAGKLAQGLGVKLNETEIHFYTDKMQDELDWAKKLKAYLGTAVENDEFCVYLQPKYDAVSEQIKGAEALVRWRYHGKEMLSPGRFIPIFEKDGSISKVDDIVLKKVCEQLRKWKEEGTCLYPISVNLSRKRMDDADLIEKLCDLVDSYGVDHSLIDFELTESAVYNNQAHMISVISRLKNCGFKVSMDDFGTGYSSLSLLTLMPIDTLKIDKSFVDRLNCDKDTSKECRVVEHIISMAKDLDICCLAEGAEEKVQTEKLRKYGCELIQGYYYSKPLPIEEYEKLIKQTVL